MAVEYNLNLAAAGGNFPRAPLTDRPGNILTGGNLVINRAGSLLGLGTAAIINLVVNNLNLHSFIGRVAFGREPQSYTAVAAPAYLGVKLQDEVTIFLRRDNPGAFIQAVENPIFYLPRCALDLLRRAQVGPVTDLPAGQTVTWE